MLRILISSEDSLTSYLRRFINFISIDYLSVEKSQNNPKLFTLMTNSFFRSVARLFIIPARAIAYFCIQLRNASSIRKFF